MTNTLHNDSLTGAAPSPHVIKNLKQLARMVRPSFGGAGVTEGTRTFECSYDVALENN
ncbi:MAG: hypothetical protein HUK01_09665 [Bacteroidaceae bacterium]|nr:hypothetical protein [Bacteroidaceae bacterium]